MKLYIITVFIFYSFASFSQREEHSIDSLRKSLNSVEEAIQEIQILDLLGIEYMKVNLDSSLFFYQKCIEIASELKNDTLLAKSYNNIGRVYTYIGITDESLNYILKSAEIYKKRGLNVKLIGSYNNIGVIYYRNENLEKALDYYQLAVQEANNNKDEQIGRAHV